MLNIYFPTWWPMEARESYIKDRNLSGFWLRNPSLYGTDYCIWNVC